MTAILASGVRSAREPRSHSGRERLGRVIWLLLFLNVLPPIGIPTVIPINTRLTQLVAQASLAAAMVLVLVLNRHFLVRPNLLLMLMTLLGASSVAASMRTVSETGTVFRGGRFCVFILVLWLLTPLWTRRDLLLRWHMIALMTALSTVVLGALVKPGGAFSAEGRLQGELWPIPPTQVAHYAAVLAGITFLLLIAGSVRGLLPWCIGACSCAILLLAHTRTATIAMIAAGGVAAVSLITIRRRARVALIVGCIVVVLAGTVFGPAIGNWYTRGSAENVSSLSGRTKVWDQLLDKPRSGFEQVFGIGLTNKSFAGRPVDNGWLAAYQDSGLFGVVICAAIFVSLLMMAATRPRGPNVAVAIFIIFYVAITSLAETGLGDASTYMLDLTVAASLIAGGGEPRWSRQAESPVSVMG
ncbi:MAG: O-antigen ligase family protein [Acidimicrobiia bacterium]